jgi:hypothetical protein
VLPVNSEGKTEAYSPAGLLNAVTVLNELGSNGWECVGYNFNIRNNLNFWTMKKAVVIEDTVIE